MRRTHRYFSLVALIFFIIKLNTAKAQDTLHLNYHHTQILPHDSTQARIDKWVKSLNGQHVNIKVIGYYHRAEFKKFAQQRVDELFLVLNRKARALITIDFIGPKKGDDWQRTMVDIVYTAGGAPVISSKPVASAKPEATKAATKEIKKEESAVKKEEKKEEKVAEKSEKKSGDGGKGNNVNAAPVASPKSAVNISMGSESIDAAGISAQKDVNSGFQIKQDEVKFLRTAKIIIARTENANYNKALEKAVNANWNFNSNVSVLPYKEAVELLKTDKNAVVMSICDVKFEGKDAMDNNDKGFAKAVVIEKAKGKVSVLTCIPEIAEDVTEAGVIFAVSAINSLLNGMEQRGIPDNKNFNAPFMEWSSKLAEKTLLLPKNWMTAGMSDSLIADSYKGKHEVVDLSVITSAIVSKSNKAYVMVVRGSVDGNLCYLHYLMDAQTGNVLEVAMVRNTDGLTTSGAKAYIGTFSMNRY